MRDDLPLITQHEPEECRSRKFLVKVQLNLIQHGYLHTFVQTDGRNLQQRKSHRETMVHGNYIGRHQKLSTHLYVKYQNKTNSML